MTVSTPFGDQDLVIDLNVDGEKVSGAATHPSGAFPFDGGVYKNDEVKFHLSLTTPVKADLKVKLKADGDAISGKARSGLLSFGLKGTRA